MSLQWQPALSTGPDGHRPSRAPEVLSTEAEDTYNTIHLSLVHEDTARKPTSTRDAVYTGKMSSSENTTSASLINMTWKSKAALVGQKLQLWRRGEAGLLEYYLWQECLFFFFLQTQWSSVMNTHLQAGCFVWFFFFYYSKQYYEYRLYSSVSELLLPSLHETIRWRE